MDFDDIDHLVDEPDYEPDPDEKRVTTSPLRPGTT